MGNITIQSKCPLCFHTKNKLLFQIKGLPLYSCGNCHCHFIDSRVYDQNLKLYKESFYHEEGSRFNPIIEALTLLLRKIRMKLILKYKASKNKILDIGCGRGEILKFFKSKGWDVVGLQLSKPLADSLNQKGIYTLNCPLEETNFRKGEFDVITMFHVLEHLKNPDNSIEYYKEILKKGGLFIIEVPNIESWSCSFGKQGWLNYDIPNHIVNFGNSQLHELMSNKGFKVLEATTRSLEFGPYSFLQSFLNRLYPNNNFFQIMQSKNILSYFIFGIILLLSPIFVLIEGIAVLFGKGSIVRFAFQKK